MSEVLGAVDRAGGEVANRRAPAMGPVAFDLPGRLVSRLEALGEVRELAPRRGLSPHLLEDALCVVLNGVVLARHGAEPSARVAELLFPGDAVGETLAPSSASLSMVGVGPARVVVLPGRAVDELLASVPPATGWLAASLAARVQRSQNRQLNLRTLDVRARLAAYLSEWSAITGSRHLRHGSSGGLSQNAMAEVIGANRATVNREVQALVMRGILRVHDGGMWIADPDDLARHGRGAHPYLAKVAPVLGEPEPVELTLVSA